MYKALVEKTKSTPGAKVENNKFCLSVHFRCVDEKVGNALLRRSIPAVDENKVCIDHVRAANLF